MSLSESNRVTVEVALPLPLDVAARVMLAINREFPGAVLAQNIDDHESMVFAVNPHSHRDPRDL